MLPNATAAATAIAATRRAVGLATVAPATVALGDRSL